LFLALVPTTRRTTSQAKGGMFYPKINQQERESLCLEEGNHLQSLNHEDPKVIIEINLAPGPGTYRLQSDFGHYDEILRPTMSKGSDMIKTGRTTSTSFVKRD
jgi:hypothetical protein